MEITDYDYYDEDELTEGSPNPHYLLHIPRSCTDLVESSRTLLDQTL